MSEVYVKEDDSDVPSISITPAASTSSCHEYSEPNVRVTVHSTPETKKNLVRVHQVKIMDDSKNEMKSATVVNLELTKTSENTSTISSSRNSLNDDTESPTKKVTRTPSNGTKRKVKLRRMGSRQNSKTETESDEETANYVLDTPRKCKRKTSRAKKIADAEKSQVDEKPPQDDVVYVLKIKESPKLNRSSSTKDGNILISPVESCVQLVEGSQENLPSTVSCDIFVKTQKKIFSPVENESGAAAPIVVAETVQLPNESISPVTLEDAISLPENRKISNLPPLPQSPIMQRKSYDSQKCQITKELSPSIQLMIAKYNKRLSAERSNTSPLSSGSCSPVAWRSPILDRRVRAQTQKYEEKVFSITKSSSAGHLENCSATTVTKSNSCNENDRAVKKSQSAGAIEAPTFKIVNIENQKSPTHGSTAKEETPKKERQYKKHTDIHPSVAQKSGAIRKICAMNQKDDPLYRRRLSSESSQPDPLDNAKPVITRKYDKRPPTPLTLFASESISFDSNQNLSSTPTTPETIISEPKTPITERALKILKAKEEFLNSSKANAHKKEMWNNRLSQISAGSGSSLSECAALMKSASVGIIGQTDPEPSSQPSSGYTSLPRNTKPPTEIESMPPEEHKSSHKSSHRFGLSNIASKLRKVKLRKSSKDLTNMNAVSALCRQSLMVDITRHPHVSSDDSAGQRSSVESPPPQPPPLSQSSSSSSGLFRFRRHDKQDKLKKSKSVGAVLEEDGR